ncbi:putative Tyrosine--tRNA ligase 1 [Blattamonas nauphoetae]|uniref:tyrosine--tRNA ligase n=1 Tax=Blattamonas nauphoetae TaxID=2049346 RepID=A0ABQ9XLQ1_9EUKA|nr:putative Tyrosine--tRNA ligase 1 [Blattamonas nauphoetae]
MTQASTDILKNLFPENENLDQVQALLSSGKPVHVYDTVVPDGKITFSETVRKAHDLKTLVALGCTITLSVGDWISSLMKLCGGNLEKIRSVANYYIETLKSLGVPFGEKVQLIWTKEEFGDKAKYWEQVLFVSQCFSATTLKNISRDLLGLKDGDLCASHIMLPCMHCANMIFGVPQDITIPTFQRSLPDIVLLSPEHTQIAAVMTEYCQIKKIKVPLFLKESSVKSLAGPAQVEKKSILASTVFIDDTPDQIKKKITKAFFDPKLPFEEQSSLFNWISVLILPLAGSIKISDKEYKTLDEIRVDLESGAVQLGQFKTSVSEALTGLLQPVHQAFSADPLKQLQTDSITFLTERPKKAK